MVVNGASRRGVAFWTKHLVNDKKNDRAELKEIRGLAAENLRDALLEMGEDAQHTRCKNFFYQANFNPCAHERLTEEEWQRAFEIFEKHRGIPDGQARIVYEHEKEGRVHRHVIWSRIDLEHMRAWPDALDAKICHAASREISEELGLERSPSPFDRDLEGPRPERAPKPHEMFRGLKSGIDPREMKAEVTKIYQESGNATEFIHGLREHGYEVVRGDRRDFCLLDTAGEVHSLARRIKGVNAKELGGFMGGIDRDAFPTIQQAKKHFAERNDKELRADLATVEREIAWEEKLAAAAIEKEKQERRFVEPTAAELRKEQEGEKLWPLQAPKSEKTTTHPKWHFEDAARETSRPEPRPVMPENLRGTSALIWDAYQASDSPRAFASALKEHNIVLAGVTKREADQSHRDAAFAKAVGGYLPRYEAQEIVAVTERGAVYRLNERTTGVDAKKAQIFLKGLDRSELLPMNETMLIQNTRLEERIAETQAFRDMLRDTNQAKREKQATEPRGKDSDRLSQRVTWRGAGRATEKVVKATKAVSTPLGGALGAAEKLADAFSSLFDAPLSPAQKVDRDIAVSEREADARQHLDIAKYTAERAQEREREDRHKERERDR